ncbi:hypothetical protein K503DRAFT_768967 [Rhizopogon vinicolor AM-OR11-026]|uniref:K Homology domain-containing protein n=1 Tax=Rhizopogon vinicolor AM-OR11-026 TaxID=1314800 RepID=A0A1B7N5E0_9AGAM|nr:hypothetical protein K503DRAFT_768967 [Rhizopogon vinicolor AM-OR11-026]
MSAESPVRSASASPPGSRSSSPINAHDTLTLRALISTKEAAVIIGKGGKNVADLLEQTGVRAGISGVTPGVYERVLTVGGSVEAVAKAYNLIISQLVSSSSSLDVAVSSRGGRGSPNRRKAQEMERELAPQPSIRLLICHNLMDTIIGRKGAKIKAIQDALGARMVPSNNVLPQSTERIVEVQGTLASISRAIEEIGKCLLEDWERGQDTVLFHPGVGDATSGSKRSANGYSAATHKSKTRRSPPANLHTQNISIPSDMVGCIIGRSGSKITETRRLSGSKISIASASHDDRSQRITISGTLEANQKALSLIHNQLERAAEVK